MSHVLKRHALFFIFYGALFLAFLWPLLILKESFLFGDYRVQIYPWLLHYANTLKSGGLPYWTDSMALGFPLVAEGQIAAYYPPHLLGFFLLPFKAAYTWSVPFHILLGGIGFYLYAMKSGQSKEASVLSAILFSFSTAYGGCFYVIGTLRTLAWLPWCLYGIENFGRFEKRKAVWTLFMAFMIAFMWMAGFPQAALYALLYLFFYILFKPKDKKVILSLFIAAGMIGFILALPQVVPTLELISRSVRANQDVAFATWGSIRPPAVISLIFPEWGRLMMVSFYIGILPLALVLFSIFSKKSVIEKTHIWLALLFLILSFGKYIPGYEKLIALFSLTFIRNPAKFIFFVTVSLAMLAGFGFDKWLLGLHARRFQWISWIFVFVIVMICLFSNPFVYEKAQAHLESYTQRFADSYYASKTEPLHEPEYYREVMKDVLSRVKGMMRWDNPHNYKTLVFATLFFFVFWRFSRTKLKAWPVYLIVIADLFLAGYSVPGKYFDNALGLGFVGNARPWLAKEPEEIPVLRGLQAQKRDPAVEWVSDRSKEIFPPNQNMSYGITHAGAYSPLLLQRHYELTKELGFVDASLGRFGYSEAVWNKERGLLDAMGARWVVAEREISWPDFAVVTKTKERYFYENKRAMPLLYAVFNWKIIPDKKERLLFLKSRDFDPSQYAVIEKTTPSSDPGLGLNFQEISIKKRSPEEVEGAVRLERDALIVFRGAFYPRWKAELDGRPAELLPVNHAFCGVFAKKGDHRIRFSYDKNFHRMLERLSLVAWIFAVAVSVFGSRVFRGKRA